MLSGLEAPGDSGFGEELVMIVSSVVVVIVSSVVLLVFSVVCR